ncbi:MAG: nucleotidyltransferase domain-containing protein [Chitinophagales bacterium]
MQPQTIEDIRNYFIEHDLFNKYNLTKIGVFGSFARGEKFNDIDLLIEEKIERKSIRILKNELTKNWEIKVDIVPVEFADPIILYNAKKEVRYASK